MSITLKEIKKNSPDLPRSHYKGGTAYYSVHCCWWTSFPEDLGNVGKGSVFIINRKSGLKVPVISNGVPCCPHCHSPLYQAPLQDFIKTAMKNKDHYGKAGINAFLRAHHKNSDTCHKGWENYQ